MQPKENQSLCSTCPDKFTHILISVSPSSDPTEFWKSLVRPWEGRQLSEPCKICPPFLYHPASYLTLKGYSRRDTWRISYWMMVAKQQVSSRATPLCSGLCQTKHFSPSPPINELSPALWIPPHAVRPIVKIKEHLWVVCVEHGAEQRPPPYLRTVSSCGDRGNQQYIWSKLAPHQALSF